jgi:hypothetical protein
MPEKEVTREEIGDLRRARVVRLEATRSDSMSERLARLHVLCKQMVAIKGAATR